VTLGSLKLPRLTFWRAVLVVVVAGGLYGTILRFAGGLGASTALNDSFPWGLWIGFDVLCGVALAAGGFTVSAAVYVFHLERFRPVVRPAILTAFLGYVLVISALMFDLGQPWRIWHAIVHWNPHSVMFEVSWCVMLYTTVLALEFSPMLLERLGWKRPLKAVKSIMAPLVIAGVLLSMLHQSSLGSLYLIAPHRMHPLWYSPLLPVFFFISAVCLGCSMTIFESFLSYRAFRKRLEIDILSDLGKVTLVALVLYAVLRGLDLASRGSLGLALEPTYEGRMFLAEVFLGTLVPVALLAVPRVREDQLGLFISASLVVSGFIFNRLNVSIFAFEGSAGRAYSPALPELFVTLMFVGFGFLFFALAVKYLPVFPDGERVEAHEALPLAGVVQRPGWNFRTALTASWALVIAVTLGIAFSGIRSRNFAAPAARASAGGASGVAGAVQDPPDAGVPAPPDVTFEFQKAENGPAKFRHSTHLRPGGADCMACHAPYARFFEVKPPSEDVAADADFHEAPYCGTCHDGEKSFAVGSDTCTRCHEAKTSKE
jgi:c(7)-type cytochrome triheme protein